MSLSIYECAALLGALFAARHALSLLSVLYRTLLRPGTKLTNYGQYALVTGATDGIGKAIAHELANKGLSIVLISRSPDKLAAVAEELREERHAQPLLRELDVPAWQEVAVMRPRARGDDAEARWLWARVATSCLIAMSAFCARREKEEEES